MTVDAFPQRTFAGHVEKIEPQAVIQQSVTNFPVLISVSNESGVLLPGMNGEVTMLVDERNDVPAIPVDAVRSVRELPIVAQALGLDPARVKARVDEQMNARAQERAAGAPSDSMRARWRAMRGASGDSTRGGRGGGGGQGGGGTGGAGRANRAQIAFVKNERGLEPRVVRLGLSDFDYAQVLGGVNEGEQVVLLGVAEAQANRAQTQSRIRERMGSGVPGVPGAGGGAGGRGGGGGGR